VSSEIITFGCRLNAYESRVIEHVAAVAGLADAVIVNTCAVTALAERQARQAIRKARRERPGATIIVTGCAAQIDPARYAAMTEVDRVLGNSEKLLAASYVASQRIAVADIMAARETTPHPIESFTGRARAVVEVQQGCDHRCTFCVIPFGRGNSRSLPIGEIVRQVRMLAEAGFGEIVLSGVDITGFGGDLPGRPTLGAMVRRVLALVPELKRLRLSSLDPAEIDEELWRLVAEEERLMPHLHLSLQSGDDIVLKRMKRRHSRADAVAACRRARALRPGIALGADLIAGFPTESEAMFANTLALVEECALPHLHVFPYSRRPGTKAALMPQLPGPLIRERAAQLRAAGAHHRQAWLEAQLGNTAEVVVERGGRGHTEHYAPVRLAGTHRYGDLVKAQLLALEGDILVAEARQA
jgi:threonylcarbamoyladenosine tRNA methylthiotransferase MtaB